MPVNEEVLAVGAIKSSPKERQNYAQKSRDWVCPVCKISNAQIAEQFLLSENDATAEEELSRAGAGMPQLNLRKESDLKNQDLLKGQDQGPQVSQQIQTQPQVFSPEEIKEESKEMIATTDN